MYFKIILIFFISNLFILSFSNEDSTKASLILETTHSSQSTNHHLLQISIGTPNQNLKVKLSSAFCGLLILNKNFFSPKGFDPSKSTTSISHNFSTSKSNFIGKIHKDHIKISNYLLENISFLLVNKITLEDKINELDYDGIIGFGYKCTYEGIGNVYFIDEIKKQLLKQNKNNKNIHNVFSLELNDNNNQGIINIGEIDNKINVNSNNYKTVDVDRYIFDGQWQVKLYSIYFDNNNLFYKINSKISIGIGGYIFNVDKKFFDFVVDNFFKNDNECEIKINNMNVSEIYCNDNYNINKIGNLSFVVGKWNFKIYSKKLFINIKDENNINKKWFVMVHYNKYDQFYISQSLFTNSIFVYDIDNNLIGIYNK